MNKKKILSLIMALVMLVGVFSPLTALAADEHKTDVVLHKIELSDLTKWTKGEGKEGDKYNGGALAIADYFGEGAKELAGVKFYYYKLEDEKQFKEVQADTENNKTKEKLEAKYTALKGQGKEIISAVGGVKIAGLVDGYYWFVEDSSSYTDKDGRTITDAKAVPFGLELPVYKQDGTMFGIGDNALHVYPKNTLVNKPKMDKNFDTADNTKTQAKGVTTADLVGDNKNLDLNLDKNDLDKPTATRNIGDKVPYKVETKIPQGAKYQKLVWTDVMTNGLTFDKDSLTIEGGNIGTNYEIVQDDRGFTLKLTKDGLKAVEEAAKNAEVTITLKYSATINKDAKVDKTDENDIALDYGNKPGKDSEPKEGNPKNKEISVEKSWDKDGDNKNTEADANAKVVYTLQEKDGNTWKNVKSVQVGSAEQFKYTFKELDDSKTYRVVERVSGYEPQYTSFENGTVKITNKGDKENPKPIDPSEPKVVTGGKKFVKTDEKDARLSGAQFYVKNKAGEYLVATTDKSAEVEAAKNARDKALKDYNDRKQGATESKEDFEAARKTLKETFEQKQTEYFEKFEANATAYTFKANAKNEAYVLASDEKGRLSIKGLAYGEYTLEEKEAPAGYAKQTGEIPFTVKAGSYDGAAGDTAKHIDYKADDSDKSQGKQIVNKKVTIPQTGGMGTVLFTVVGISLMAGAVIAMKRNREEA